MITKRIQIYTNRIAQDLTPYLTVMFQYYLKHGVTLNYDIAPVNVTGYQSTLTNVPLVGNVYTVTGADKLVPQTDHDIAMFVFDLNEWKAPWYWPWPLWGNVPRDSTYMANGKPFITIGFLQSDIANVQQRLLHEPMHALAKIYNASDVMDTYILDSTPDAPGGNFSNEWAILNPIINKPMIPIVTLTRTSDNGVETQGILTYGTFSCNTLERPWKDNNHDVSCIPKGTYNCTIQPFHSTHMYELSPTAPRTGIFIHPANYVTDLLGCIGLGVKPSDINNDGQIDVTSSVDTVAKFMNLMGNNPFTLIIQ